MDRQTKDTDALSAGLPRDVRSDFLDPMRYLVICEAKKPLSFVDRMAHVVSTVGHVVFLKIAELVVKLK